MENAKKMILIEPEAIERLKKDNANTTVNNLSQLDEEMSKVLKTKLDDREKWSLYQQTLQRYLYFIAKDRKPIEIPLVNFGESGNYIKEDVTTKKTADIKEEPMKTHERPINENIPHKSNDYYTKSQLLQLIPKTYKIKGELLIDILLKNKNKINWNDDGTIFIDNKKVYKSNIVDLINDVVRPLKNSSPHGWVEFSQVLKDLKVPLSYIGNPKRATFINVMSKTPDFGKTSQAVTESSSTANQLTPQTYPKSNEEKVKRKIAWERWTPY